jgi:histone deacetylase 8
VSIVLLFMTDNIVYICSKELVKVNFFCQLDGLSSELPFKVSSLLPSNKGRSTVVHSLTSALGLMNPGFSNTRRLQIVTPSKASYKDLAVYHTRDYLDTVLDLSFSSNQASNATEFGLEDVSAHIVPTPCLSPDSRE